MLAYTCTTDFSPSVVLLFGGPLSAVQPTFVRPSANTFIKKLLLLSKLPKYVECLQGRFSHQALPNLFNEFKTLVARMQSIDIFKDKYSCSKPHAYRFDIYYVTSFRFLYRDCSKFRVKRGTARWLISFI